MWYMIAGELQKIWKRKAFLIILFVMIAANIIMLFYSNLQTEIPDNAYKKFDSALKKMPEKDRENYINEYAEKIEGLVFIENINLFAAHNPENGNEIAESMRNQNPELYDKYYNDWESKNYALYTDDIFVESSFIQDIKNRTVAMPYDKYLEKIAAREQDTLGISIFAGSENNETKENVFSKKVIHQTAKKYSSMSGIETEIYTYKWVDNLTVDGLTEILLVLITFILVYQMIYEEKKKKLFGIIRAMPRGRTDCAVSKIIALLINTGLVTFFMYGVIFAYSAITVGIYGINSPIQSVAEFIACPYKLNVWQFLMLSFAIKWIVLFSFGLVFLFISIFVAHYCFTFAAGIGLFGVGAMEYYLVSGASKWNIFHYLNVWQFLKSEHVVGNYVLLNIFQIPSSVCMLMVTLTAVITLILVFVCVVTFSVSKNLLNERAVSLKGIETVKSKISRIGLKQRIYKRVWGYESYKIFVMNLGILIIVLFGVGMIVSGKNVKCYLTPNEMSYKQWMQNLNGKLTEEKEEQIQNQKNYYDEILKQLENLEQIFASGEISEQDYDNRKLSLESQLAFYPAFQRVYERYEYVKQDSDRQFVYEEGYNKLMGKKDHLYLGMFMIMNLVLILFLTTTFTTDKEKGMYNIIRTAPKGRGSVVKSKIAISFLGVCCMYFCFLIRNIYIAQTNYGMESLFVSASNLKGFGNVPEGISILLFLVGFALLQIICILIISLLMMFVSGRIGNTVHAIVWEIIALIVVVVILNQIYTFID